MLAPQVQTDRGLFKVTMPKQNLDRAQISSGFQQMRREAVTAGCADGCSYARRPARTEACRQAVHSTLVVTGRLDVCHRLPGNSHTVGLCRSPRQ